MSLPSKCRRYFQKPFIIRCVKLHDLFTEEEIDLLKRYGNWMKALMDGEIEPDTERQKHFVKVCRGEIEPETPYERIWMRYLFRLKWEADPANKIAMGPTLQPTDGGFGGSRAATEEMHRQQYRDMVRRSRGE